MDQLLPAPDAFTRRHIGPDAGEQKEMLKHLGLEVGAVCCNNFDFELFTFIYMYITQKSQ